MQWHPTYNRWSLKNKEMEALESKGTGFAYFETCEAYTFLNQAHMICKEKKLAYLSVKAVCLATVWVFIIQWLQQADTCMGKTLEVA